MRRAIAALLAGILLCAQTPMLPGFPPGTFQNRAALDATPAGGITFTDTDAQTATPAFSAGTFSSVAIGAASSDRVVVLCWVQNSGSGIAAPTYSIGAGGAGGTAFTAVVGNSITADQVAMYSANITTGTVITIAFPGGASGISLVIGYFTGQSGGGGAALGNTGTYTAGGAQPLNLAGTSQTVPASGIGVSCGGSNGAGAGSVFTWTNTTSVTGDRTTGNATATQIGLAHLTTSAVVTVSSTNSLSFGGTMAWAAMAP